MRWAQDCCDRTGTELLQQVCILHKQDKRAEDVRQSFPVALRTVALKSHLPSVVKFLSADLLDAE